MRLPVTVLMDLPPGREYATATVSALDHAAAAAGVDVDVTVVSTSDIDGALVDRLAGAVVVGPGSPYRNPEAVFEAVRSARERGVPLVGT